MLKNLRELLKKDRLLVLATSDKNSKPNAVVVASCGVYKGKILIADCQFNKTLKNLRKNKNIALCAFDKKNYFQIKGKVKYFNKGKYFNIVKKINEGTPYKPKGAILVSIEEVWDLNKGEGIKCL